MKHGKHYVDAAFFFKQKTAYEISDSDWSSDVCSSDLTVLLSSSLSTPARGRTWFRRGSWVPDKRAEAPSFAKIGKT